MKLGFVLGADTYSSSLYNATKDVATELRSRGIDVECIFLDLKEPCRDGDQLVDVWGLSKQRLTSKLFSKLMKALFGYVLYTALFSRMFCRRLERFASSNGYDVLIFHVTDFSPFHQYKKQCVTVLHTCVYEDLICRYRGFKKKLYQMLYKRIYKGHEIWCVSESAKRDILDHVGVKPAKISVIHNGFDFERMKAEALSTEISIELPQKFIMAAGRPDRTKRFDLLIDAFSRCKSRFTHKLIIFGDGRALPALQELAVKLGVDQSIVFAGFVGELLPVFRKADLYVLSSDIEGLPTVLIESLLMETPVVATDAGGVRELLSGTLARFVSSRGDPEQLAKNIDEAIVNPPKVGLEYLRFLSKEQVADKYLDYLGVVNASERAG